MGRKSLKEKRQAEIINACYEVAKEVGVENISIAKVANRLNINPSLIIHYFKNKEELVLGLIDFTLERYEGIFLFDATQHPTMENLQNLFGDLFSRKWNDLFDDGVFYSCYALSYRDERIRKSFKILHDSLREMLAQTLEFYKKENLIYTEDTTELVEQIFILVEGAYYYLGMIDDPAEYEKKLKNYRTLALNLVSVTVT